MLLYQPPRNPVGASASAVVGQQFTISLSHFLSVVIRRPCEGKAKRSLKIAKSDLGKIAKSDLGKDSISDRHLHFPLPTLYPADQLNAIDNGRVKSRMEI